MSGTDSSLQAGFSGTKLDRAAMSLGEDVASWAVDGLRRLRLHQVSSLTSQQTGSSRSANVPSAVEFRVGDKVEGMYSNGKWYPAEIAVENADGTFELRWTDGDTKDTIKEADKLRRPGGVPLTETEATQASSLSADGGDWSTEAAVEETVWGAAWRQGDVVGLACDLSTGEMLVSVNGSFEPPNGAVFTKGVQPGRAAGASMFPAFSGRGVRVAYNFGSDPNGRPFHGPAWPDLEVVQGERMQADIHGLTCEVVFGDGGCVVGATRSSASTGRVYYEIEILQVLLRLSPMPLSMLAKASYAPAKRIINHGETFGRLRSLLAILRNLLEVWFNIPFRFTHPPPLSRAAVRSKQQSPAGLCGNKPGQGSIKSRSGRGIVGC